MEVRLLGEIEAADTEPFALGGPTQRRVLATLALRRNEVVSIPRLVDVIWAEGEPPERAEHNVRTYVHRLRSSLDGHGDRIDTVGSGYRLRLDDDEFDVARFERLAGTARRLADTGDAVAALDLIDEAERLWRGAPIQEFEHETWAMPDAVRLRELYSSLRSRRAELLLELGQPGEATALLEVLVRAEPLREQPRALLMRALYESGRQADALRAFHEFRQRLIDEVGIEPSLDLAELDRSIATGRLATAAPARTVGGYVLHERIGEGAFAVVHRATQESLGREVAVKIIRAELANRPEFIRRFEAEAQMVARIEHPSLVPLYDFWREPDRAYLVMRWMTGGSLHTRLDDGPWQLQPVIELVDQIAGVLTAAHRQGVVHRDVKPENILFDNDGRAYLADFGIALEAADRARPEAALSEGSPIFASPEQLRREPVGPEADIHALAIVTYTLLVGRPPFADTLDEPTRLQRHLHEPIPPVRAVRPELPERIDQVLAIAAAKQPSDRYPTATAFALALRAAADAAPPAPTAAARSHANPYKGLRAFDETDSADFFGRERLIDELVGHFDNPDTRLLALVGPSGSGKSSVIRAGLVPALRQNRIPGSSDWFITTMIPGTRPYEALETALLRVAVNPPSALVEQLRDGDRGILRAVRRVLPDDRTQIAIVIDQFEELFTTSVTDEVRDRFLEALSVVVAEPGSPLRVVLTIRADFYDRPLRHPRFASLLKQHTIVVTPLAPDELEHAITSPAATAGVTFEPGLVAEIIADVNHEPGGLPLLQYALTQTFDQTDTDTITIHAYRKIGGLTGALAQRAEQLWQTASADEQQATRRLFGRLVTLGEGAHDTRRRVQLTELGTLASTDAAIERYGEARLLTFDRDPHTREPTIEIAHEALLSEWPRLGEWLDDDRDDIRFLRHLNRAAHEWDEAGRNAGDLYRGGRLETAERWASIHEDELHPLEQEYLDASLALRDAEAAAEAERFDQQVRSNKRLRTILAATAVIAAIALVAGVVAFQQRSRADDQAAEAQRQADAAAISAEVALDREAKALDAQAQATKAAFDAETGRLVATAQSLAGSNPRAALLVASAAYQRETSPATLGALQTALVLAGPQLGYLGWGTDYSDVEWLTNDRVVGVREDGLDLFDPSSGQQLASIALGVGRTQDWTDVGAERVGAAAEAPLLAVASDDTTVVVYEVDDAFVEQLRVTTDDPVFAVGLSPDGSSLVATDEENRVTFWDRQGTVLFSEDLDDSQSLLELAAPVLGPDIALGEWLAVLPVGSAIHPNPEAVMIGVGSYVHPFDWNGNQLGEPLFSSVELEPGQVTALPNRTVLSDGAVVDVILNSVGAWFAAGSGPTPDPGPVLLAIPELLGGGTPSIAAALDRTETSVLVVLSTGEIGQLDTSTRSFEPIVDPGVGASPAAVMDPGQPGRVAVASPTGVALVSLVGAGPISYSIPRNSAAGNTGISSDGRFAVTGGAGAAAPTTVWANDGSTWIKDDTVPPGPDEFAGISPGHGDPILMLIGPTDGGPQFHSLTGEHPEYAFELTWVDPAYTAGDGSPKGTEIVQGGPFGIQVYAHPSGEPGARLSFPPGSGAADISGLRFDPSGDTLLISARDGRSQLWNASTWEPIEVSLLDTDDIAVAYWNQDGSLMATASSTGAVSIRDGETFDVIRNMVGATGTGNTWNSGALLFSPDNRFLLTNFEGPARLWDVATGEQIGTAFPTLDRTNSGINVGESFQLITTAETSALIWNLDTTSWPDIACRATGSNLTQDEWTQWGPRDEDYRAICPKILG